MTMHALKTTEDLESIVGNLRPVKEFHLGEILVDEKIITEEELRCALQEQQKRPKSRLGNTLVEMGLATRTQINSALARKFGIPAVTINDYRVTPEALSLVPADIALQYNVLPLAIIQSRLIVAMENPLDWEALDVLRFHANRNIDPLIASHEDLQRAFGKYYGSYDESEVLEELQLHPVGEARQARRLNPNVEEQASKKPIVRLLNAVLLQGVLRGASDIHVRPGRDRVDIYYRIDGQLQLSRSFHKSLLPPLVSRVKITGQMDVAEHRRPQGGHARLVRGNNTIDLRLSTIPTVNGESVVIRILDKESGLRSLDVLGFDDSELATLREILAHSYGIFLVTGPTGSGKSTTLYALLDILKARSPHIITVEDPVEYAMDDVEQIQILPAAGYTFAEALRQILRHDPDVIMVGEIRDLETARIATKAALTGHLVLSTLHTNDAASAITRLTEMGIEPYLLSSTLLGTMAQRLVRKNCTECRIEEAVEPTVRKALGIETGEVFYRGAGCASCGNTGYRGRIAVCELLPISRPIAQLMNSNAGAHTIKQTAVQKGMHSLTQNALELARRGITSLEEVFLVRLE